VEAIALPLVSSGDVLGLSIAVVEDESVLLARGYGHTDLALTTPCDPDTVYWIASVTKLFTAATVLRLAEEGQVDLGRELSHYLPEVGKQWDGVRLHHLLSHTSGIPDFTAEADGRAPR
jgi:CubicO group peptidase (beta-lactamase class C family)